MNNLRQPVFFNNDVTSRIAKPGTAFGQLLCILLTSLLWLRGLVLNIEVLQIVASSALMHCCCKHSFAGLVMRFEF